MASRKPHLVSNLAGLGFPGTRRPWAQLLAGLGLVVLLDLVIALARPSPLPEPVLADDLPRARAAIARAKVHDDGWLLLGDSVLAGDVMQATVPRWSEHRVLDSLRREQAFDRSPVGFEQIALDGMLPVDMLRIVRELDTLDPTGRVGVVLEINPRFFSAHYAKQEECSREFLCMLGQHLRPQRWAWVIEVGRESWWWLGEHLPIWRHRDAFPRWDSSPAAPTGLLPRASEDDSEGSDADDPLVARARILEHYGGLRVSGRSAQYRALRTLVERLRARGRRGLLFATPLNDGFMAGTLDGERYGRYVADLDQMVNRPGDTRVRFVSLDHPSLRDPLFLDHAHLGPEGNRWLALNLLHQLGVGLATVPPAGALAYEEGPDRSVLARVVRGNSEGAPWQAAMNRPHGIDVAPGGGRVVVADTGNHCLRELVGPLTVLHTLAGRCGDADRTDGTRNKARFERPRLPLLLGDAVYVIDGRGRQRVREIRGNRVRTLKARGEQSWSRIDRMRGDGRYLWLIDHSWRLLRVDPRTGDVVLRYESSQSPLLALDVGPDGRIYLADGDGRLWQLLPGEAEPVLLFANDAEELLPQDVGDYFPFDFDELALDHVIDLRYVDRYDAILVQDEHRPKTKGKASSVPERVHLRLLSPRERKVYPWVHPLTHGGGHVYRNVHTKALSSNVHDGSMALDPGSATLFYVERDRTRLLALGDGLYGTAKLGHHVTPTRYGGFKDVFGLEAGQSTMLEHHPERWAHRRLEPLPRRGPYVGLMLGSSMTAVTEVVGQYSLARVMERELVHALGVGDGIRFDMVQRSYRGPRLGSLVNVFESFVERQAPVDVVFFELHSGRMLAKLETPEAMVAELDRIRRTAERYGTRVVMIDNDAMVAPKRDGLRATGSRLQTLLELCEQAGFVVLRPSDLLLREAIDHAPWGNAPFKGTHGSTWSMDVTGRTLAALVLPELRAHLRGRVPALMRGRVEAIEAGEPLFEAFDGATGEWPALARDVASEAMQKSLQGSRLELLVDLGKAGVDGELTRPQADALVLGFVAEAVVRDPSGRLATEVEISLARFRNYDEYGVGVLEGAEVVDRRVLDRERLEAFLEGLGVIGEGDEEEDAEEEP